MHLLSSCGMAWCCRLRRADLRAGALVAAQLLAGSAAAQSTFGSFVGTVRDASGAVVPSCAVEAVNKDTSARRSTITGQDGSYVVVNLEPGIYEITLQAPGFQREVFRSLELLARQTVRVDAVMAVATQTETVNVSAAAESVITTDVSSIAVTKTGKELIDLPVALTSRASGSTSPITTLTTQAGVQTDNNGNLSVAGSKPSMMSVSIDGISSMSPRNSAPIAELFPSFSTIAEIRVSEINNSAEFGGISDITTTSRSGTNSLHGGFFENNQVAAYDARNPFSAVKPKLVMNDFGGYFGGPVVIPRLYHGRNRTFFFASYEGLRLPREQTLVESVPSVALRNGDLSAYLPKVAKDPTTGNPFPNNQIPVTSMSSLSLKALQYLFPMPNAGAANAIANNYVQNMPTPISSNQGDIRLDQQIDSKQTAFARLSYKRRAVENAPTNGSALSGPLSQPENDFGFTLAHNYVITPHLVNEARGGFSGAHSSTSYGITTAQIAQELGIANLLPQPLPPGNALPSFSITGFQGTNSGASSISLAGTRQLLDNLTWTKGRHTIKIGGDFRHLTGYYSNVFATTRMGSYSFNGSVTNSLVGIPYAAFLLGIPDRTQLATVTSPDTSGYANHWAFFAQDDWKITPRLTLNYGLRWEYHPMFMDHLNNTANFLPDYSSTINGVVVNGAVVIPDKAIPLVNPAFAASIAPTPILTATQAGVPQSLRYSSKTDFAPRIGFAWRPFGDDKTVIRGGWGRYIETELGALLLGSWAVEASDVALFNQTLVNGKPTLTFPYPFPANLAQPGSQDFDLADSLHYKDPYVQQWNFTIERDLGLNTGLRISYDGSKGSNLGITTNRDELPANTVGFAAASQYAPFPLFSYIYYQTNGARSNYNALTVAANKRMSKGLEFQASYVFARNLSNGGGYNPTGFAGEGGGTATDQYNLNLDYGNVAYTRRNRFLATFLYNLPFWRQQAFLSNAGTVVNHLVGGWELAGVLLFQSGPFLTVTVPSADPAGTGFPNLVGNVRADMVSGVSTIPANQSISGWINPAAFSVPANNIGRYGNSPVGSVIGPGTQAVSLSLFKSLAFSERVRMQVGGAAANALNHPNYGNPNTTFNTAAFGTITSMQTAEGAAPRSIQVTARLTF